MADLCEEDMLVQISSPQILAAEGGTGGAGRAGCSGSVELGRRLLLAARRGDTQLVHDLMAKGAPFTADWLGTSPLHLAAHNAHVETCGVLLRAGVSRDCRTKVERTPLHLAAHAGHAAVAQLLLAHGARADCRDMLHMTPLHWAAQAGHARVAQLLLRHGADPLARSKFLKTPLQLAAPAVRPLLARALERRAAPGGGSGPGEIPAAEQQQALASIEKLQEMVKPLKHTPVAEPITAEASGGGEAGGDGGGGGQEGGGGCQEGGGGCQEGGDGCQESGGGGQDGGAALLRRHGITLLPRDTGSTVLNAIQSGRTVVLSDAGKLMLKESSAVNPPKPGVGAGARGARAPLPPTKGVVVRATPVRSPPRPGVKIFTLSNKLLGLPKENKAPVRRVVNPHDFQSVLRQQQFTRGSPAQLQVVQLPRPPTGAGAGAAAGAGAGAAPLKIIVQKPRQKHTLPHSHIHNGTQTAGPAGEGEGPEGEGEAVGLRRQLAAAQAELAALRDELGAARARLARLEPTDAAPPPTDAAPPPTDAAPPPTDTRPTPAEQSMLSIQRN